MNAEPMIVTGDHAYLSCPLYLNGAASPSLVGATVTAAITNRQRSLILAGPITLSEATAGSDWANRVVVTTFDGTHTTAVETALDGVPEPWRVGIEIQTVEAGIKTTWFALVPVVRGLLP